MPEELFDPVTVTEQKRSEARLAQAQQIAGVGSWHWDPDAHQIAWSAELRRMLGLAPEDAPLGDDTLDLVHPDDREVVAEASRTAMERGGTMELELRMRHADGGYRLLLCRGGATLGPDGTARRFDGTCEDITERRRAQERLAEAQRLGQIGSFDRDLEAGEVAWSPETYRIFGVDPEHHVPSRENVLAWSSTRTASGSRARSTGRCARTAASTASSPSGARTASCATCASAAPCTAPAAARAT